LKLNSIEEFDNVITVDDLSAGRYKLYGKDFHDLSNGIGSPSFCFNTLEELNLYFRSVDKYNIYEVLDTKTLKIVSFYYKEVSSFIEDENSGFLDYCLDKLSR